MMITIDGPSASGKSTLAKTLAQRLNIRYLDSGAFYRSIAAYLIENNVEISKESLEHFLSSAVLKLDYDQQFPRYFLNQQNVTTLLRNENVAFVASQIARYPFVRQFVNKCLIEAARFHDCVADGRDLGSKVFKDAKIKFFLTASIESRAKRREMELKTSGLQTTYETVLEQLQKRDEQDIKRDVDPLVVPKEAFFLDTTHLTTQQVCELLLKQIQLKLSPKVPFFRKVIYWCLARLIRQIYDIKISNLEVVKTFFSGIVYANHLSYLDAPLLLTIFGPMTVFVAHKKVLEQNIFFRLVQRCFPLILVDEQNMPRDFLAKCRYYLNTGHNVVIFPEGKRGDDGRLLEFKNGLPTIVSHIKCANLLAVAIKGTQMIWPKNRRFFHVKGDITVTISDPLYLKESDMDPSKEGILKLRKHLEEKLFNLLQR